MNGDTIRQYCDQIDEITQLIRDETHQTPQPPNPPDSAHVITAEDDLQTALDIGGLLLLESGADFDRADGFSVTVPGTAVIGLGANGLASDAGHTIAVPPGVHNLAFGRLALASIRNQEVIRYGRNDDQQTTIESAPDGAVFRTITNAGHRGKRCFSLNGRNIRVIDCTVEDLFQSEGQDSQAIWIGNCPGPVEIEAGYFEAASECLMVGGDAMKIPNCRPTGITVRDATFTKLLEWKHAGTPKVKNIFELKDGHDVLIQRCQMFNCWQSAQDGYALMMTPTRGGSLRNVVIEDCHVWDVGGIVNITGVDADDRTLPRTQVTIRGGEYRTNKAGGFTGPGRFCLIGRGPESFEVDGATIAHEGSAFIDCSDKDPIDYLAVTNSVWNYGDYGIRIGGYNHGDNALGIIRELIVEGNTISGAHSQFKSRYPNNTYVEAMSTAREREIDRPDRVNAVQRQLADELRRLYAGLGR
jgi:hypothetical protein